MTLRNFRTSAPQRIWSAGIDVVRGEAVKPALLPVVLFGISFVVSACASKPTSHRYEDSEYGFALTYPAQWTISGAADKERREELAKSVALDAGEMARLHQKQREVVSLKVVNSAGEVAGRLSVLHGETTASEFVAGYLLTLGQGLKQGTTAEVSDHSKDHRIQGRLFEQARLTIRVHERTVHQEVFATPVRSGSLLFAITAADEADLARLRSVISTMNFSEGGSR